MMSSACQNRFEAHQAAQGIGAEALDEDLRHHRAEPKEPGADMQPCRPTTANKDDRKALRSGPAPSANGLRSSSRAFRTHLRKVAYRKLGSVSEADDAVHET
jgi:hypothetical protein